MKLSWVVRTLKLKEPLAISRGTMAMRDAVEVTLTHDGFQGHGEVVTSRYYGLDLAAINATLSILEHELRSCPVAFRAELGSVRNRFSASPGVVAAVDAALHDLLARSAGCAVHQLLGLDSWRPVPTAHTIGIADAPAAATRAKDLAALGFTTIKVKLGGGQDEDVVAAVRQAAPDATLLLDPNGAWNREHAASTLDSLVQHRIAAVEQPVPPGHLDDLAWVSARSPIPVLADEDACCAADIPALAGKAHGVNVKLAECGGLDAALEMIQAARDHGMHVLLGCQTASSLGVAPAVHLAPLADWLDLDGHLLIADDPWVGLGGQDGVLRLEGETGLGVRRRS